MKDFTKDGQEHRICYKCRKEFYLNDENFYKNKSKNKGYEYCCKKCAKSRLAKYYSDITESQKNIKNVRTKEYRDGQYSKGLCNVCKQPRLYDLKVCRKHYLMNVAKRHLGTQKRWKELEQLIEHQQYKCSYTGKDLILGLNSSIDHIKPLSIYPELNNNINNLQWVDSQVNFIKTNMSEEEFLFLIKQIYEYRKL